MKHKKTNFHIGRETGRVVDEREQRLCFSVYIADNLIRNFYRCSVNVW